MARERLAFTLPVRVTQAPKAQIFWAVATFFLLALLLCKVVKPKQLEETSGFFLNNMTFFFVPTCVGILKYRDVLFSNFWAIVLISILTTPLVFFVTGHVVQATMKYMKRKGEKKQ